MKYYIGVDLGTSSIKGILTDSLGKILRQSSKGYDVHYPREGWTEQDPADWMQAFDSMIKELIVGYETKITAISFGGQMHGLVILDKKDRVIRPCILWNDSRTVKQTEYLNKQIGQEKLSSLTGNIAFAGFTAPKLLWLRENEPDNFERIDKIMLPKDYLAYYLSGVFATDYSDASGTLLLDVEKKCWSEEMCRICDVSINFLPKLYESSDKIGEIKPFVAEKYGLSKNVQIIIGAGDNAAAAVGTGTVKSGDCNISIGTSGTVFICEDAFKTDENNSLHAFVHSTGKWHLMGCILSAASCRKWWLEEILSSNNYKLDEELVQNAKTDNLIFLPYLSGERSPYNDVNARGAFIGLSATTTRAQMSKAVMEGVAFAIKDCLKVAENDGVCPDDTNLCGGGAKSEEWKHIFADVLNIPVRILTTEQGPGYGAAILSMVGSGEYSSIEEACEKIIKVKETILPNQEKVILYRKKYEKFHKLYPLLKEYYKD